MGNRRNEEEQSGKTIINPYEKMRMIRVQQNRERLLQTGVLGIRKSLTSLVESQKKKRKKGDH